MTTQITLIQNREMARRTAAEMKNAALRAGKTTDTENLTMDDIHKSVKATNPPGTRLLVITAEANSPEQAKDLANATAHAFVVYKKDLATIDMFSTQHSLEREAARAARAMDEAERQERLFKQVSRRPDGGAQEQAAPGQPAFQASFLPPPDSASRLRQNMEIATELYKRLETALAATKLQRDLVRGDVTITQYADAPKTPS